MVEITKDAAQLALQLSIERYFLIEQLRDLNECVLKGIITPSYKLKINTILKRLKGNRAMYDHLIQIYVARGKSDEIK